MFFAAQKLRHNLSLVLKFSLLVVLSVFVLSGIWLLKNPSVVYGIACYDCCTSSECGPGYRCSGGMCVCNSNCGFQNPSTTPPPPQGGGGGGGGGIITATPPPGAPTGGSQPPPGCGQGCCVCTNNQCLGYCGGPGIIDMYFFGNKSNGETASNQSSCTNYAGSFNISVTAQCIYSSEGLDCGDGQPFTPSCSWEPCGAFHCTLVKDHGYQITADVSAYQYQYWNDPSWWGGTGVTVSNGGKRISYKYAVPDVTNGDQNQSFTLNHQCINSRTELWLSNGISDYTQSTITDKVQPLYLYTQVIDSPSGYSLSPTYTNGRVDYSQRVLNQGSFANINALQNRNSFTEEVWNYGSTFTNGNDYQVRATYTGSSTYCTSNDIRIVRKRSCDANSNTLFLGEKTPNNSCASSTFQSSPLTVAEGTNNVCLIFNNDTIPQVSGVITNETTGATIKDPAGVNSPYLYNISGLSAGSYNLRVHTDGDEPYCSNNDNATLIVDTTPNSPTITPTNTPTNTPSVTVTPTVSPTTAPTQLQAPTFSVQSNTINTITWTWNNPAFNSGKAEYVWFQISDSPNVNAGPPYPGSFVTALPAGHGIVNTQINYPTLTNQNTNLTCGQDYYAHVRAEDLQGIYTPSNWSGASFNIPCPSPATVSGSFFEDTDVDGTKDAGESLVSGASINIVPTYSGGGTPATVNCTYPTPETYQCTFSNFTDGATYNFGSTNLTPYSSQTGCSGPGGSCSSTLNGGDAKTLDLGFVKGSFLQTSGGSIHAGSGITMEIPQNPLHYDTGAATSRIMVLDKAGVVTSNGTQTYSQLSGAQASTPNYKDSSYSDNASQFNYAFFESKFANKSQVINPSGSTTLSSGKISDGTNNWTLTTNNIYQVNGNLTVQNDTSLSNVNAVILVNGNLTISNNFRPINSNSYVAFIVSGTITINPTVTEVHALLLSDGQFSDGPINTTTGLKIVGAVHSLSGFTFNRRQTVDKAGEYIVENPAYFIKLATPLGLSAHNWEEVNP